jgi:hypothetical protein
VRTRIDRRDAKDDRQGCRIGLAPAGPLACRVAFGTVRAVQISANTARALDKLPYCRVRASHNTRLAVIACIDQPALATTSLKILLGFPAANTSLRRSSLRIPRQSVYVLCSAATEPFIYFYSVVITCINPYLSGTPLNRARLTREIGILLTLFYL